MPKTEMISPGETGPPTKVAALTMPSTVMLGPVMRIFTMKASKPPFNVRSGPTVTGKVAAVEPVMPAINTAPSGPMAMPWPLSVTSPPMKPA